MLQASRDALFNTACGLDNKPRVRFGQRGKQIPVEEHELYKARIQANTEGLYVIFTEDELAKIAEVLRELAAQDDMFCRVDRRRRG